MIYREVNPHDPSFFTSKSFPIFNILGNVHFIFVQNFTISEPCSHQKIQIFKLQIEFAPNCCIG